MSATAAVPVEQTTERDSETDSARFYGTQVEEHVFEEYPVAPYRAEWFDGRVYDSHPLQGGREVQIKGARKWIKNGSGRTRGRFCLWDGDHRELVEQDALYLFAVYDPDKSDPVLRERVIPARELSARVDGALNWQETEHMTKDGRPARVNWRRIFPE